jgi:5-methylcytosine-specific restriction endonuclease McrA
VRRSPLNPKRSTPRRNEGRVHHDRMRPKASAPPTAEQQRYHFWLRSLGQCEACPARLDLVIHHILARVPGKQGRRDHWFVVLICAPCHNGREDSVHGLGSESEFQRVHGVDLVAVSVARLQEWRNVL